MYPDDEKLFVQFCLIFGIIIALILLLLSNSDFLYCCFLYRSTDCQKGNEHFKHTSVKIERQRSGNGNVSNLAQNLPKSQNVNFCKDSIQCWCLRVRNFFQPSKLKSEEGNSEFGKSFPVGIEGVLKTPPDFFPENNPGTNIYLEKQPAINPFCTDFTQHDSGHVGVDNFITTTPSAPPIPSIPETHPVGIYVLSYSKDLTDNLLHYGKNNYL